MPSPAPVPSREALRSLRRLAFSNPAAVGGAAVGACCLLLVQYDTHRRLRLAQQVVDTKKTLHSLSNGTRQSYIERMFQKAENGEDFLCRPVGAARRLKKRNYSAVNTSPVQPESDLNDLDESKRHGEYLASRQGPGARRVQWDTDLTELEEHREHESPLPMRRVTIQRRSLNKRSARQPLVRLVNSTVNKAEPTKTHLPLGFKPHRQHASATAPLMGDQDPILDNFNASLPPDIYIPYHAPRGPDGPQRHYGALNTHDSPNNDGILDPFNRNGTSAYRPTGLVREEVQQTFLNMRETACWERVKEILSRTPDVAQQVEVVTAVIRRYLNTGIAEDALLAHNLTNRFGKKLSNNMPQQVIHELEDALLRHDETKDAAKKRLFTPPSAGTRGTPQDLKLRSFHQRPLGRAISHLQYAISQNPSSTTAISLSRKLLQTAIDAGLAPSDELVVPVIRYLCDGGQFDLAKSTLSDLSNQYGFEQTFYSLSELVRASATRQDWSSVDDIIGTLHANDWSRQKALGYASLLKHVVSEFALHNHSDDIYDLVSYYIENFGLIPNTQLSSTALCAFIRDRRFDLAQTWVRQRQARFPDVPDISETNQAAVDIAQTWADMHASTADILKTCKALASGAVRDPFSASFRSIIVDAVCTELCKHCRAVEGAMRDSCTVPDVERKATLTAAYESAYELVSKATALQHNARLALLRDTLTTKMTETQEINKVVGGAYPGEYFRDLDLRTTAVSTDPTRGPALVRRQTLPSPVDKSVKKGLTQSVVIKDFAESVFESYEKQRKRPQGTSVDHSVLEDAITKLCRHNRYRDAANLIRSVRDSDHLRKDGFSYKLYMRWLEVATQMRDPPLFRDACWAVLNDPNPGLTLDSAFYVQALIGSQRCHRNTQGKTIDKNQWAEAYYVVKRIAQRILNLHGISRFASERGLWEWAPGGAFPSSKSVAEEEAGGIFELDMEMNDLELLSGLEDSSEMAAHGGR